MMVLTNKLTLIDVLFDNVNTISFSNYRKLPWAYSRVSAWENVKDPFTASKSEQCVQSLVKIDSQMKEKILQYRFLALLMESILNI